MKKFFSICMIIVLLANMNGSVLASNLAEKSSPYNNYKDYGISIFSDTEHSDMKIKSANSSNVLSILEIKSKEKRAIDSKNSKGFKIEKFSPELIAKNLKNLKVVNEFARINERYIIDYDTVNNERVIVEYYDSGVITKNIYNKDTDEMVIVSNASNEKLEIEELSKGLEFELSDEQMKQIDKALKENNINSLNKMEEITLDYENGILRIEPAQLEEKSLSRSNTKKTITNVEDDFPTYTKKTTKTTYRYLYALNKNINIKVKESRNAYVKKKYSAKNYLAGTALTAIGIYLSIPLSTVTAILTVAGVVYTVVSGVQEIQESIEVAKDAEYSYLGAKEGYVYDTTAYHDDVKVYLNSSKGTFDGGYNKYGEWTWIESPASDAYDVSSTKIINKTFYNYEACIVVNGYCSMYMPD